MNISKKCNNVSFVPKKTFDKENTKLHTEITADSLPFSDSKSDKSSSDKISIMSIQIASIEDTLSNFTCLIKLLQSCVNSNEQEAKQHIERQEEEKQKLENRINMLEKRLIEQEKQNTLRKEEQTSSMLLTEQTLGELELRFKALLEDKFKTIEKREEPLQKRWDEVTQKLQESNQKQSELFIAWKQSVEEQLQSFKKCTSSKVEAAEVSRVLNMLEEEIDRRELGDTKLSDIVNNMEESFKQLAVQFANLQKPSLEPMDWKKTIGEYRQGGDNLKSIEKSLTKKLKRGIENIQKIVENSSSAAKSSSSLFPEPSNQTEESKYSESQKGIDEKYLLQKNIEQFLSLFWQIPINKIFLLLKNITVQKWKSHQAMFKRNLINFKRNKFYQIYFNFINKLITFFSIIIVKKKQYIQQQHQYKKSIIILNTVTRLFQQYKFIELINLLFDYNQNFYLQIQNVATISNRNIFHDFS